MGLSPSPKSTVISLRHATYGFVVIGLIIAALGSVVFARNQRLAYQAAALDLAARVRVQGAELDLSRSLEREWDRLAAVAGLLAGGDTDRAILDAAFASDGLVGWAGLVSGVERAGDVAPLEGAALVADAAWLGPAISGPFVGLATAPNEPAAGSALVFVRPVSIGTRAGVLAAFIPADALKAHLTESAAALGMEFVLTGADGAIIASSLPVPGPKPDLPSLRGAAAGLATSQRETWADGMTYFVSVIPLAPRGEMPVPGWRLVGRIDPVEFAAAETALSSGSQRLALVLLIAIGGLTALFVGNFVAPFEALARNVDRIADGFEDYPYEGRQTKEVASISAGLVRIRGGKDS